MADIKIGIGADCEDERGERGKRGHRGRRGPPGPGTGGLLKFAGVVTPQTLAPTVGYLTDTAVGVGSTLTFQPAYPTATERSFVNLSTNVSVDGLALPPSSQVVVQLLKNSAPVAGFSTTYGAAEIGVKTAVAGPVAYAVGDTFDVQVTVTGIADDRVDVTATVGLT